MEDRTAIRDVAYYTGEISDRGKRRAQVIANAMKLIIVRHADSCLI